MFGLLTNSSQIYGLQQAHEHTNTLNTSSNSSTTKNSNNNQNSNKQHRRSTSSLSDTVTGSGKEGSKLFATLSSMQGSIKSPTNFIEKFLKTELLNSYDSIKNYKNFQHTNSAATGATSTTSSRKTNHLHTHTDGILTSFNCLQGSYRSSCDSEFYEAVNVNPQRYPSETSDMTIKCSKNILESQFEYHQQAPATLQNYQKLSECEHDMLQAASSGASSGEFNTSSTNLTGLHHHKPVINLYKKLSFGYVGRSAGGAVSGKNLDASTLVQSNEIASDNSSSSISTTTTNSSTTSTTHHSKTPQSNKSLNDLQRSSSASSSGDCTSARERKKSLGIIMATDAPEAARDINLTSAFTNTKTSPSTTTQLTSERAQRRKLIQMISNYDQQNKLLQRELAKEKRRRTEDLACVVKSLICFESKLKVDMKSVNQRLAEKDEEICRLVCQNRALKNNIAKLQANECDDNRYEGVVENEGEAERNGGADEITHNKQASLLFEDCLVLEALQCINCRKQFYDIDNNEGWKQAIHSKDGSRQNDGHTTEHGSSSDDTVSSSFYGARRSVRYTSKRTAGTFRDYMRSRSMNIDDPALDQNSEENTSTISRDVSQTSYEKINIYSRTIERMHGVKCESERESELSAIETTMKTRRLASRLSNKSNNSVTSGRRRNSSGSGSDKKAVTPQNIEEDDGIFSPTQDDDFDEAEDSIETGRSIKIVPRRSAEFSEASPKQVYETSTDDWYASASDQEEIGTTVASKSYGHGAVNPVLECVNQILLQQSMEESAHDNSNSLESSSGSENNPRIATKSTSNHMQANQPKTNLPRRSSLSGRRHSRSNSHSTDANESGGGVGGQTSATRNGNLPRKRVHFSTKNSMVHVPRNNDNNEDDDEENSRGVANVHSEMISNLQQYHHMSYHTQQTETTPILQSVAVTPSNVGGLAEATEQDRLETLSYESIYSNEYEPIGSEHNSSNLYVDMESTIKMAEQGGTTVIETKIHKFPPALPPKPANLLKFKKSLQQLGEMPDKHLHQHCAESSNDAGTVVSEPDYCSISEVNVRITSVKIVADVHQPPESDVGDLESQAAVSELDLEVSTLASDDTFAASQKTDEIEEIFADIPKLPNVAAIIAPKNPKYQQQHSDYLIMSPKVETTNLQNARNLVLNTSTTSASDYLSNPHESAKLKNDSTPLKLQLNTNSPGQQYKRKHMPNILAEINKRMSQPNSPSTSNKSKQTVLQSANAALLKNLENSSPNLPLQAEFDWYNLDAEYGSGGGLQLQPPDLLKVNDNSSNMLAEIQEDYESVVAAADEYNLDEEFSLTCEKQPDVLEECEFRSVNSVETEQLLPLLTEAINSNTLTKFEANAALNAAICEAVNFPLFRESENSSLAASALPNNKANKMKNNLANFEKFIEGSGLSTKPLPSKRKIYFAGPFV